MNALLIALLCTLGQVSVEQCANGVCVAPSKVAVLQPKTTPVQRNDAAASRYKWTKQSEDQWLLRRDGKIIGQWSPWNREYYPWDGIDGSQGLPACKPPIDPPGTAAAAAQAVGDMEEWKMSGVAPGRMHDAEQLTFGGKVIEKSQMADAFEGKLTDDSSKGYFIISAKQPGDRARVLKDYQALPAEFRDRYHLWMADPSHFTMQDRYNGKPRFYTDGDPTIILQNNKGEVLFRRPVVGQVYQQADMRDLLKADPNYNPALDPGAPAKKLTDYLPSWSAQQWGYLGVGAFVGLLTYRKRKEQ